MPSHKSLNQKIIACDACPRLRRHCQKITREKRASYQDWEYWGKPVANFGAAKARFFILGLAPAAHGANRTGRMFTGDRSGDWLYRALFRAGFANQATSRSVDDGLILKDCVIGAVAHCAPPDNKPLLEEKKNCQPFLKDSFEVYPIEVLLCLGGIAWDEAYKVFKEWGWLHHKKPKFSHGAEYVLKNGIHILGSYHPSQQNTFTGRLTEEMFDSIFERARELL